MIYTPSADIYADSPIGHVLGIPVAVGETKLLATEAELRGMAGSSVGIRARTVVDSPLFVEVLEGDTLVPGEYANFPVYYFAGDLGDHSLSAAALGGCALLLLTAALLARRSRRLA